MSLKDYYCKHCDVTYPEASRSFIKKHPSNCSMKPQRTEATIQPEPQMESTSVTQNLSYVMSRSGRQIAVNNNYLCYAFNPTWLVVANFSSASFSVFISQSQSINDMAFFAEDVHLLACAGIDGRIFVLKFSGEKDEPEATWETIIALLISGKGHPCVCWHLNNQEILIVGYGQNVFRIDTKKAGKDGTYTVQDPLLCFPDDLCDGVKIIGRHEGEVTDLSMCKDCLVSASIDGKIKLWLEDQESPVVVLRPYDGQPVFAANFFTAPNNPGHIVLVTVGPDYREVKIWVNREGDGLPLPLAKSLRCTHILDLGLKSSSAAPLQKVFSKRVVALSQAGLLLFANASRSAITIVRIDYGPNPLATRMDNVSELAVNSEILSLSGICDAHGLYVAQIYCLHSKAIMKYTLKALATASIKEKKGETDTVQTGAPTSQSKEMTQSQAILKYNLKASATTSVKEKKGETDKDKTCATTSRSEEIMQKQTLSSKSIDAKENEGEAETNRAGLTKISLQEEAILKQMSSLQKQMEIMTATNESMCATNKMQLQECTNMLANFINKDLTVMLEKAVKIEMASIVDRGLSSDIEKSVTSAISELFQRVVGDKVVAHLEKSINSKLEIAIASQIQAQFQVSGMQKVDSTFQKGMFESTSVAQQHFESKRSPLMEAINTSSSLVMQLSGPISKFLEKMDPLNELDNLILEDKFEEAFIIALGRRNAVVVSWLCSRVGLPAIMSSNPCPLSQSVLLSLLEQLGRDLERDTERKLLWMMDVAKSITPTDPKIASDVRPIVGEVLRVLGPLTLRSKGNSSACQLQQVILSLYASCN